MAKTLVPLTTSGKVTTAADAAVTLITVPAGARYTSVLFRNYSVNDALVSIDGGTVWIPLGAGESAGFQDVQIWKTVQVKNAGAGLNVTVSAEIW
ncbi:MAG TPA: hypothetical protein VMY35_07640 [Phycisphaerae bacterium]|nr:hypothetical protein [Phycisphaerae bacterium]